MSCPDPESRRIALRDLKPRLLAWDGAIHDGEDDFRWVIRHRQQKRGDWCWAACVRNALSCFGVEVDVREIVGAYFANPDSADDQGLDPERMLEVWKSRGFTGAQLVDGPLHEDALAQELREFGPVEIERWAGDDDAARHVVLVTGYRTADAVRRFRVSDPLATSDDRHLTYDELLGPAGGVAWRRTFRCLEYRPSALRRFVYRPALYYAVNDLVPQDPEQGAPKPPMFGASSLRLCVPGAPNYFANELHTALCGYRHFAAVRWGARSEVAKTTWLGEAVPMVTHSGYLDPDRSLGGQWAFDGWASLVYTDRRPRYYVWSDRLEDGEWYSRWVGEKWTRNLAAGLRAAAARADSDDHVQIARARFWQLYLIRLVESERYLVAHVRGFERPFDALLSGDELAERLRRAAPREFARGLTPIGDAEWAV